MYPVLYREIISAISCSRSAALVRRRLLTCSKAGLLLRNNHKQGYEGVFLLLLIVDQMHVMQGLKPSLGRLTALILCEAYPA